MRDDGPGAANCDGGEGATLISVPSRVVTMVGGLALYHQAGRVVMVEVVGGRLVLPPGVIWSIDTPRPGG
jgi:hypothetical protein